MAGTLGVRSSRVAAVKSSAVAKSYWRGPCARVLLFDADKAAVGVEVEIAHPAYADGVARVHPRIHATSGSRR
jgi:hypothetical protein